LPKQYHSKEEKKYIYERKRKRDRIPLVLKKKKGLAFK
jgi:hypothetical protein